MKSVRDLLVCDFSRFYITMASCDIYFNNLLILGFNVKEMNKAHRLEFHKDMFRSQNQKAMEVVIHFLLSVLDQQNAKDIFHDCWPVTTKSDARQFRQVVARWIEQLENQNKFVAEFNVAKLVSSRLLSPVGIQFYQFLARLSSCVLYLTHAQDIYELADQKIVRPIILSNREDIDGALDLLSLASCNMKSHFDALNGRHRESISGASQFIQMHSGECSSLKKVVLELESEAESLDSDNSLDVVTMSKNLSMLWRKLFDFRDFLLANDFSVSTGQVDVLNGGMCKTEKQTLKSYICGATSCLLAVDKKLSTLQHPFINNQCSLTIKQAVVSAKKNLDDLEALLSEIVCQWPQTQDFNDPHLSTGIYAEDIDDHFKDSTAALPGLDSLKYWSIHNRSLSGKVPEKVDILSAISVQKAQELIDGIRGSKESCDHEVCDFYIDDTDVESSMQRQSLSSSRLESSVKEDPLAEMDHSEAVVEVEVVPSEPQSVSTKTSEDQSGVFQGLSSRETSLVGEREHLQTTDVCDGDKLKVPGDLAYLSPHSDCALLQERHLSPIDNIGPRHVDEVDVSSNVNCSMSPKVSCTSTNYASPLADYTNTSRASYVLPKTDFMSHYTSSVGTNYTLADVDRSPHSAGTQTSEESLLLGCDSPDDASPTFRPSLRQTDCHLSPPTSGLSGTTNDDTPIDLMFFSP